jgi:hypothetical protein
MKSNPTSLILNLTILPLVAFLASAPLARAQTPPPAQKAKFIAPVKGLATIEVQQMSSKRVGKEMVTIYKVKNTSKGTINLLKADEYWYDTNRKVVSGGPYAHTKAPIQPGEIVEITLKSPYNPQMKQSQVIFAHANGKIDAKAVKNLK